MTDDRSQHASPSPDPESSWGLPYGDPLPPPVPMPDLPDEDEVAAGVVAEHAPEPAPEPGLRRAVVQSPSPQGPPPPVRRRPVAPRGTRDGGRPPARWIPAAVAIGLVAVVVLLLGSSLLSGGQASPSPSAPLAVASPSPSGLEPSSAAPSPTPTPKPVRLTLKRPTASSAAGGHIKAQARRAIDDDRATAWHEGATVSKGQWIEVTFDPARADTLIVRNGDQASDELFAASPRLRDVAVTVDGGKRIKVTLEDTMKAQRIDLGGVSGATTVRLIILSTYPAEPVPAGVITTDDAAVSELRVIGVPGG